MYAWLGHQCFGCGINEQILFVVMRSEIEWPVKWTIMTIQYSSVTHVYINKNFIVFIILVKFFSCNKFLWVSIHEKFLAMKCFQTTVVANLEVQKVASHRQVCSVKLYIIWIEQTIHNKIIIFLWRSSSTDDCWINELILVIWKLSSTYLIPLFQILTYMYTCSLLQMKYSILLLQPWVTHACIKTFKRWDSLGYDINIMLL